MTTNRRRTQSGNAMVEFTLVGIGLMFVLISIFEMSRGMWIYHTLAHTSKEATRFLIVHGSECQDTSRPLCRADATLGMLASRIKYHGVGLLEESLEVQVYRNSVQVVGTGDGFVTVGSLMGSTTIWAANANRGFPIQVGLRYPFKSALAFFWPGAGRVNFATVKLGANSWDTIQF